MATQLSIDDLWRDRVQVSKKMNLTKDDARRLFFSQGQQLTATSDFGDVLTTI